MTTIQTNTVNGSGYNQGFFQGQRPIETAKQASLGDSTSVSEKNSIAYIKADYQATSLRNVALATGNINDATSLVQSIDASAATIESELLTMKAMADSGTGCLCQRMRKAQESIEDTANSFSWNGLNPMLGGGENNQRTTTLEFLVATGTQSGDNMRMSFKSFNPKSAVATDGSMEPLTPNLPDLNKSSGTDTHAYGDAALYSSVSEDSYLHLHTQAMRDQAILQLSRAIDGVKTERERLGDYISQLNNLSKATRNRLPSKGEHKSHEIDAAQALKIAGMSKDEILKSANDTRLKHANVDFSLVNGLLN
jgi:hypothetical protein